MLNGWTLLDHQGSVRDVLDEGGALKASARYDGYGNVTERTTGLGDPLPEEDFGYLGRYGWTGRERDAETGLQHNRARYYDPRTGRWLSLDPLGFAAGDANLYRYVGNAPTGATDPSGKIVLFIHGIRDNGSTWMQQLYWGMRTHWLNAGKYQQIGLHFRWAGEGRYLLNDPDTPSVRNAHPTIADTLKDKNDRAAVEKFADKLLNLQKSVRQAEGRLKLPRTEPISIVAHSQGTMVTLAALKLLKERADKAVDAAVGLEAKKATRDSYMIDSLVLLHSPQHRTKEINGVIDAPFNSKESR